MSTHVTSLIGIDMKVLGAVVEFVAVDVMHNFACLQPAPQHSLGDKAMLKDLTGRRLG